MTSCWILSPSQLGHLERSYPRTEAAPTLSASYTGKPGPRERRELPCVSGRASTGTEGTPRLGLHLTVSLRPHTMRAGSSGLGERGKGAKQEALCQKRGHSPPSRGNQRLLGSLAGLAHPAGKQSSEVSLCSPVRPLALEKPREP